MINEFYGGKLKESELKKLLNSIKEITTKDLLDKDKEVVLFDTFLNILLKKRSRDKEFIEKNIESFFKAADIDENGFISCREFITFLRSIDNEIFGQQILEEMYIKEFKVICNEKERNMTIDELYENDDLGLPFKSFRHVLKYEA